MPQPHVTRRRERVGIDDVARAAGVSRQTVSNVINNGGRFSDETRVRVLAEVARLGYRAHGAARSLRSRFSHQLALPLSTDILRPDNVIMAQFLHECILAAAARDHHLVVSVGGDSIPALIAAASVDAFLLADVSPDDPRVALLVAANVPFACFGRTLASQPQSWVDIDNVSAVAAAVRHLAALGHRDLAYLGYSGPDYWNEERERGFVTGIRENGLSPPTPLFHRVAHADVDAAVTELLRDPRTTAVVTGSDALAAAVYRGAAKRGVVIGRDLSVTGVDGSAIGGYLQPSLTTVAIPTDQIARAVVERALVEVATATNGPGLMVSATLTVGESSRAPRSTRSTRSEES